MPRKKIGQILVEKGHLDEAQLKQGLETQKQQAGRKIGQILLSEGVINAEQISEAFSEQTGIPLMPDEFLKKIDATLLANFPIGLARKFKAIPLFMDTDLHVAVADTDTLLFNQLYLVYKKNVIPYIYPSSKITDLINHAYSKIDSGDESLNEVYFVVLG